MPEFCTCGAQLPADARFCHRCGKPQREEPVAEAALAEAATFSVAPPAEDAPVPVPLSFRNPIALRVGLLAAGLFSFIMMIPGVNYAGIVWLLGAGYFSVWIYKRRTGQLLSVRSGARMGWITGVMSFALITLLFTFTMLAIQRADVMSMVKDGLRDLSVQQSTVDEAMKMMQNPAEIFRSLILMFVIMTLTCTAGGALGARLLRKP